MISRSTEEFKTAGQSVSDIEIASDTDSFDAHELIKKDE